MMAKFRTDTHDTEACVAKFIVALSAALAGLFVLVLIVDWILH